MLIDKFGREINYLRLSVTDRCNLRCCYCMPEHQQFLSRDEVLSYEEIIFLVNALTRTGITKVRITGGEPFVRKDLSSLLEQLSSIKTLENLSITTNGVLTGKYIDQLLRSNITNVNLSLDTLRRDRFFRLTRRDEFDAVFASLQMLMQKPFNLKLNMVVINDMNVDEILDFVELTRNHQISVRFIEEMPFNGQGKDYSGIKWNYDAILHHISQRYNLTKLADPKHNIALNYKADDFAGSIAVIPAYSRTLCGTCNRLRVTPTGGMKLCLYGNDVLNVKDLIRSGTGEQELIAAIQQAVTLKPVNGFEAAAMKEVEQYESMSLIGG
ncbi:GTP 3',8-cyclase MoaA [Danxiaibacter flavus]|uniref:GTP 3',8-cyclase n=1 Tax=Danxiaibacter flavus TaxID=3049108 RepID=A0ABV3ZIR8_9BACT|nr:GTP 3',8-cyclase MoaA [Chitinophagaceae bacterium DXS]